MTLDLDAVRARFPALQRPGPGGRPWVHADAPGGTQVPADVPAAMRDHLLEHNANSHGVFAASRATDALCDRVRAQVAQFTGGTPDGVVFGPNTTTLLLHLSRALDARLGPGDELVCTRLDHDANVSPWLRLAQRTGATVRWVGLDPGSGRLRLADLDEAVTARTRLVAFPGASNALGTIVDPRPFVDAAAAVGAITVMDAVHTAPHVAMDRAGWGVDVLACSAYKFCGPHLGMLSAAPELLADLDPDKVRPAPESGPERWQTGTASFEAIAGTGAALSHLHDIGGMEAIGAHEAALTQRFLTGLGELAHVRLHGPPGPEGRTPTFSVTLERHEPGAVAAAMADVGIAVWSGHYYAIEPLRALGLIDGVNGGTGAVRIGFAHYHGPDDVDRVLAALDALR